MVVTGSPKAAAQAVHELARRLIANIETVVIGKRPAIVNALIGLLSEGHVLIEDVPGVAKTVLAKCIAKSLGCSFQRVQCTPDLLPSDVTGISVYNQKVGEFEFRPGPAFANILLVDELNRATPRTQSALLECMAEGQITLDGITHPLARPFIVFATQNPIEFEGTFPLPEAQLDRFCLRMKIGYPDEKTEVNMLELQRERHPVDTLQAVTLPEAVLQAIAAVKRIYVHPDVRAYGVRLVRATRAHEDVAVGASPRASLALFRTAQAYAGIHGWEYVLPDFMKLLAPYVLEHRLTLKPDARLRRRTTADIVWELVENTPAPVIKSGEAGKHTDTQPT